MKLSVLANLYGAKSLDETLSILSGLGVHTAEIGAGGYPGKAHCNPAELLADKGALEAQMKKGAEEASYVARRTLSKVQKKLGFVQIR